MMRCAICSGVRASIRVPSNAPYAEASIGGPGSPSALWETDRHRAWVRCSFLDREASAQRKRGHDECNDDAEHANAQDIAHIVPGHALSGRRRALYGSNVAVIINHWVGTPQTASQRDPLRIRPS